MMEAGARCALHVDQSAVDTCGRCGNYVCVTCMEVHNYETYCGACASRLGYKGQYSTRAVSALILGLLPALTACAPLGIAAIVMGHMELAAIREGTAPASGKNLALGGAILGWISVALMIVVGLIAVAVALAN